jgi:hypothetical protein
MRTSVCVNSFSIVITSSLVVHVKWLLSTQSVRRCTSYIPTLKSTKAGNQGAELKNRWRWCRLNAINVCLTFWVDQLLCDIHHWQSLCGLLQSYGSTAQKQVYDFNWLKGHKKSYTQLLCEKSQWRLKSEEVFNRSKYLIYLALDAKLISH